MRPVPYHFAAPLGLVIVVAGMLTVMQFARAASPVGYDAYCNIRYSVEYRDAGPFGLDDARPEIRHSVYRDTWGDKDWMLRVCSIPFTWGYEEPESAEEARRALFDEAMLQRDLAREPFRAAPWHGHDTLAKRAKFAAVPFGVFVAMVFWWIVRREGLPAWWAVAATLILVVIAPGFVSRILMLRSHVLAVGLLMLAWYLTVNGKWRWLMLLGAVFVLTYSAAHAVIVLVGVTVVSLRVVGARFDSKSLGAVCLGVAIGFVIHPNPEAYLKVWTLQNVLVPLGTYLKPLSEFPPTQWLLGWLPAGWVSGLEGYQATEISELQPGTDHRLINAMWRMWLPLLVALALVWRHRAKLSRPTASLIVLAACWWVMFMMAQRFAEYALPFGWLAVVFVWRDLVWHRHLTMGAVFGPSGLRWRVTKRLAAVLVVVAMVVTGFNEARVAVPNEPIPAKAIEALLQIRADVESLAASPTAKNQREGSASAAADEQRSSGRMSHTNSRPMIFHPNWSLGVLIPYAYPDADYVVTQDPVYTYAKNPDVAALCDAIRKGDEVLARPGGDGVFASHHEAIVEVFDADYVIVHAVQGHALVEILEADARFVRIAGEPHDQPLGWSLRISDDIPEPTFVVYRVVRE